ncbi:hypothetical protein QUC_3382 [Clostridioides difficile P50]|nr:hypothetical protein QUC_3382 [Clostridioides difficile P50]
MYIFSIFISSLLIIRLFNMVKMASYILLLFPFVLFLILLYYTFANNAICFCRYFIKKFLHFYF